jgi:hypothetical protein
MSDSKVSNSNKGAINQDEDIETLSSSSEGLEKDRQKR